MGSVYLREETHKRGTDKSIQNKWDRDRRSGICRHLSCNTRTRGHSQEWSRETYPLQEPKGVHSPFDLSPQPEVCHLTNHPNFKDCQTDSLTLIATSTNVRNTCQAGEPLREASMSYCGVGDMLGERGWVDGFWAN